MPHNREAVAAASAAASIPVVNATDINYSDSDLTTYNLQVDVGPGIIYIAYCGKVFGFPFTVDVFTIGGNAVTYTTAAQTFSGSVFAGIARYDNSDGGLSGTVTISITLNSGIDALGVGVWVVGKSEFTDYGEDQEFDTTHAISPDSDKSLYLVAATNDANGSVPTSDAAQDELENSGEISMFMGHVYAEDVVGDMDVTWTGQNDPTAVLVEVQK